MIICTVKFLLRSLCVILSLGYALPCAAQDMEPRRWSHLPIGLNLAGIAYAHTEADISFNPVLRIEDVELELHTWAAQYIRTFEVFQKSARIDFRQAYHEGQWKGLLRGEPASVTRNGFSDSVLRASINLIGAPPLKGEKYAAYRVETDVETIVGLGLAVQLPTGQYMGDKLINLGTNRYTYRPQLGILHNRGKWSSELTGSVWIYTDNNDFFNGSTLEQDPMYFFQSHLIYTFSPGFWLGVSAGYYFGGESTVDGVEKDDRKENVSWALSLGHPIGSKSNVKLVYLQTRNQELVGLDTDTFAVALSTRW